MSQKSRRRKAEFSEEYFDPGTGDFVVVGGSIVERDALAIAEKIVEYDDNLVLMCLNGDGTEAFHDAPFVVCERDAQGVLHRVFEAWELDDRILERIYNADRNRFDALKTIEKMEANQQKEKDLRYREMVAETVDVMAVGLKRRQSDYTIRNHEGDMVRVHDDRPPTRVASESTVIPLGG